MKKLIALLLVLVMVFAFAACSKKEEGESSGSVSSAASQSTPQESSKPDESSAAESSAAAEGEMIFGKLYYFKDADPQLLSALSLSGNQAGSSEFNSKKAAAEGIRCMFELNEWVGFYPEPGDRDMKVYIFRHRSDQEFYETAKYAEAMSDLACICELNYDADAEEGSCMGSFYLNPEEAEPIQYDFVFVYEGKAIASMLTRFYPQGMLQDKSDEELEALMKKQ